VQAEAHLLLLQAQLGNRRLVGMPSGALGFYCVPDLFDFRRIRIDECRSDQQCKNDHYGTNRKLDYSFPRAAHNFLLS